jgi:hypothetical protein
MKTAGHIIILFTLMTAPAWAGMADIIDVQVTPGSDDTFSFSVTVKHADEGWDHYADRWEVVAPDGEVLGTRVLLHPHVDEQPFTRSLSGVRIPAQIKKVTIRARDSKHGRGGKTLTISLPSR